MAKTPASETQRSIIRYLRRLQALLPSPCIVCGRQVLTSKNVCQECMRDLPWIRVACTRCGESRVNVSFENNLCARCVLSPPPFQFCKAVFHYQTPVDGLLSAFKFNARFDVGYALAALLAKEMQQYYKEHARPQLIVPVPLHKNRLRARGYNQAIEISKQVTAVCDIPMSNSLLVRERDTRPQTEVRTALKRKQNLKNCFGVSDYSALENVKRIAIIDDVVTTMGTVVAATIALQNVGVKEIEIWCIARASR